MESVMLPCHVPVTNQTLAVDLAFCVFRVFHTTVVSPTSFERDATEPVSLLSVIEDIISLIRLHINSAFDG